ncbi:MAG: hypothetical protein WAU91_12305 [Desulfatitalea sp.]
MRLDLLLPGSLADGRLFVQSAPCQTIQIRVRYRGKKTLSEKFVMHNIRNGNQRGRHQNAQHTKGRIRETAGLIASEISTMSKNDNRMGERSANDWMKANNSAPRIT